MSVAHATRSTRKLGSFEVIKEIAEGGMGVVHLARQPALDRLVVLKRMRRDVAGDPSMVARFEREARAAAAVQHQNVVAVHDCFQFRGDHYIAQEYVDGGDVAELLRAVGRIDPRVAARIALAVIHGLEEIHSRGIVHRDLKPSNILLARCGDAKIADFGIAIERRGPGLTEPGITVGSVPYMSPEQMMGEQIDSRSDLYSFGILLYEMITGDPPFRLSDVDSPDTLLERMQRGKYPSPAQKGVRVPFWMTRLIKRCLRPRPGDRVQSTTAVRRLLERRVGASSPADCREEIAGWLVEHGLVERSEDETVVAPAVRPRTTWLQTHRRPVIAVALCAAAVTMITTWSLLDRTDPAASPAAPIEVADVAVETSSALQPLDPPVALPPAEPARVRFVATPWASVTVGDSPTFVTPRAAAVELDPGTHRVIFEHPTLGRAEREIVVDAGEDLVVRHAFTSGASS